MACILLQHAQSENQASKNRAGQQHGAWIAQATPANHTCSSSMAGNERGSKYSRMN